MSQTHQYFSQDYFIARARFRKAVEKVGARLYAIPLDATGPVNEELTIDVGWIGSEHPKKVLLHSSGLHGVEGFAGSAIQLQLLDSLPKLPDDTAFVFTHVLNPHGMAWLRRFNENNVDLNRNFLDSGEAYSGAPEAYKQLDSLLNPPTPPSLDFFLLRALWAIWKYGMPALRQAIGGGQYEFPRGIMFGGARLEQGPREYQTFLGEHCGGVQQVIAIDVHTGLGKFGEDTLLAPPQYYGAAKELFGQRVAPLDSEHGPAYVTKGSIDCMISRVFRFATILYLRQEFGTYGPLRVVGALREENRWSQFGAGTLDHATKRKLKETFGPTDDAWLLCVLERGRELFLQASAMLFSEKAAVNPGNNGGPSTSPSR